MNIIRQKSVVSSKESYGGFHILRGDKSFLGEKLLLQFENSLPCWVKDKTKSM